VSANVTILNTTNSDTECQSWLQLTQSQYTAITVQLLHNRENSLTTRINSAQKVPQQNNYNIGLSTSDILVLKIIIVLVLVIKISLHSTINNYFSKRLVKCNLNRTSKFHMHTYNTEDRQ